MLHVLVGASCNNNCLFCMESDREGRAEHIAAQSRDDVRAMIDTYAGDDEVLFTSGEPTLSPNLVEYVSWARDKGFKVIGLISNGRRFAYRGFVEKLLDAGLNRATVSIHGHCASLHDGLTRTPGSFRQTRDGLANLVAARRTHPLRIHTSTVVTTRNLPHVAEIHRMLDELGVDAMVFNVMMAKGRGARHLESLMPRYDDVVVAFQAFCASKAEAQLRKLRVVDVPPCISLRLPQPVRGQLEDFDQYELLGSTGLAELAIPSSACENSRVPGAHAPPASLRMRLDTVRFGKDGRFEAGPRGWARVRALLHRWLPREEHSATPRGSREPDESTGLEAFRHATVSGVLAPEAAVIADLQGAISEANLVADRRYYATTRAFKDRFLRAKGEPCRVCAMRELCPGVWEPYLARYGWTEFHPVQEAPAAHPSTDNPLASRD